MRRIFLLQTGLSNLRLVSLLSGILLLLILCVYPALAEKKSVAEGTAQHDAVIHHEIKALLLPESHRLQAIDTISLPPGRPASIIFFLHAGLQPVSESSGVLITKGRTLSQDKLTEAFTVNLPPGVNTFTLRYGGVINHPIEQYGKEYARGISQTPGLIADEGIYLAGSSYWYPRLQGENVTFSLAAELPSPWDAVSQGGRTLYEMKNGKTFVTWESSAPQEEIYLVAGKFEFYEKQKDGFTAMVFLRSPDKELADRYLDATIRYIALYAHMIGPYPYKKFALVENFWETGFGMPSFTLLGPKVLRFPFILKSSYPHEILHTWWGNTVYPDYAKGNWAEGLTAYLSDHLMKEQDGLGTEHRLTTLQKYSDYVLHEKDFPLTEFRSRHSSVSEAVGYGKSLMFFHMLRLQLGDEVFLAALRDFYRNNKFRIASFAGLQKSFEIESGKKLGREFDQWIHRPGAPALQVDNVRSIKDGEGYILTAGIHQVQDGAPYLLTIPIAVTMEGQQKAFQTLVVMDQKALALKLHVPARPLRFDIDPEFDLFRRLDRDETPPALSQALGSRKMLVILPASAESALLQAYRNFSAMFKTAGPDEVEISLDNEVMQIPGDRAVTVLGWDNRFAPEMLTGLAPYGISFTQEKLAIEKKEFGRKDHTFVFTARNPEDKSQVRTFIATDLPHALPGLGRKLPHYHKYSYLIFEGEEPENIAKDRWPVIDSPMTIFLPVEQGIGKRINRGELMPRKPLAELPAQFSSDRMLETTRYLSDREQEGRGLGSPGLDRAAEFIAQRFREAGLEPLGDSPGSYFQTWNDTGGESRTNITVKNVIGYIPGKKQEFSGQSVIVGAHYDHLGLGWPDAKEGNKGKIHPGADDNASGVAVLVELAQVLGPAFAPDRSILFIAFTGEEAGRKGSHYYVKASSEGKYPVEKAIGMVNIDTVGRLGEKKLLILGGDSAREWVHIFRGAGYVSGVEIEMVQEDLDSSDQTSFQRAGVPAVQLFTGAHADYHRPADTADKIDAHGLIKVASAAREVIEYLAKRESRLSATIEPGSMAPEKDREKRKVSLGIVPDFSYRGKGIRLSDTVPGSPAEKSGLTQGDILIRVHSADVGTLKDLADILSLYKPGTSVSLTILREGQETTVEAELAGR